MLSRAYSALEVKSVDDEQRVITGMATTPTPDRAGDIVEPMGMKSLPVIPSFLYHDSRLVVGTTSFGKPTKAGIPFVMTLPHVREVGRLQERVDEAWQMVKYKLIAAVSIGFQPVYEKMEQLKNGAMRFHEYEILELSLVPIPMQSEATINQIKGFDSRTRAALGLSRGAGVRLITTPRPGVSGNSKAAPLPGGAVRLNSHTA